MRPDFFFCDGCEKEKDFYKEFVFMTTTKEGTGKNLRFCRNCRTVRVSFPDIYFDGKPEENLADDENGKPRVFASKGQKASYLKERGIMEAGDRVHGAPVQVSRNVPRGEDSSNAAKMALKKVREMGKDVRRQAYLKIVKENRIYEQ